MIFELGVWPARFLVVGGLCLIIRRVWARSPALGLIILMGALVRTLAATALFIISAYHFPVLARYQLGDGFWQQAMDAQGYHAQALNALRNGFETITAVTPSPGYVRLLTVWLWLLGESPIVGALLNTAAYVISASVLCLVVLQGRNKAGTLILMAGVAFSPALIGHGSQALKDEIFAHALVLAWAGIAAMLPMYHAGAPVTRRNLCLFATGAIAMSIVAGTRFYIALLVIGCTVAAMLLALLVRRCERFGRWLSLFTPTVAVLWLACAVGLGFWDNPADVILGAGWNQRNIAENLLLPLRSVETAQRGFDTTAGRSALTTAPTINVEEPPKTGLATTAPTINVEEPPNAGLATSPVSRSAKRLAIGAAALLVPMSLLKACCSYDMQVSSALLILADIDTCYSDALIIVAVLLLVRAHRRGELDAPTVVLLVGFTVVVFGLLAFTVSNFGALFRLRIMGLVILWTAPLLALRPWSTTR